MPNGTYGGVGGRRERSRLLPDLYALGSGSHYLSRPEGKFPKGTQKKSPMDGVRASGVLRSSRERLPKNPTPLNADSRSGK